MKRIAEGLVVLGIAVALFSPARASDGEPAVRVARFGEVFPLLVADGIAFSGEERVPFDVADNDVVSVPEPSRIPLPHTEGRAFFVRGEVNLGGTYEDMNFPLDLASGFSVFVREVGTRTRYELNPNRMRNKRRTQEGREVYGIRLLERFPEPATGEWHSFFVLATRDRLVFQFGDRISRINGPLDMDGINSIGLAPGTRVRGLSLAFLEDDPIPAYAFQVEPEEPSESPGTIEVLIRLRTTR